MKSRVLSMPFVLVIVLVSFLETALVRKLGWSPISVFLFAIPTGIASGLYAAHLNKKESSRGDQ